MLFRSEVRKLKERVKEAEAHNETQKPINKVLGADMRKKQDDQANKTYEIMGFPPNQAPNKKYALTNWILNQAGIQDSAVHDVAIRRAATRNWGSTDKVIIRLASKECKIQLDKYMRNNKIEYWADGQTWTGYYITGRWTESEFQQETRKILNIIWQIIKTDMGLTEATVEGEEGLYQQIGRAHV